MIIIDGKKVAEKIRKNLKEKVSKLPESPNFAVIIIGNDPASLIYINGKRKACEEIGINFTDYHLEEDVTQEELESLIEKLNMDNKVNGILLQSPIPYHLNILEAFKKISPDKDVDGFSTENVGKLVQGQESFVACTPYGIMQLLKEYNIDVEGKNCVVLGRSNIVGRPMAQLLLNANGTITVCHSHTKNLSDITKMADILVVAIGKPKYIKKDMIKDGAVIIDVGINRIPDSKKIVGDVDFEDVKDKCSYITPVPGGVGPMTVATLMQNIVKAYEKQNGLI